ncbi:hypothetical protein IVA87_31160 [Bradyrhizobium sp. 147]|jgi:hypothetical protein|uniref:hypothetical protein n=1 Tax=unclassified Bradyrhizobium TaxID=2631580 RepID=UPI001FFA3E9C|nr:MULTISPECIES: hypothetical protein [unclassified Bradyrhizobium]MCK1542817.1 hypothetical protein [Bradyrhizobium sp. 179]MCK1622096.1 hypothetical protein [Bradyrhizobium sp. 160]MCK1683731.1 hypothetical protein [Bradyrhizobium sp. 147]
MSEATSGEVGPASAALMRATNLEAGPPEEQHQADSPASTTALHAMMADRESTDRARRRFSAYAMPSFDHDVD